jgi:uncharacterized membrane protein YecN with MAPEG domain
VWSSHSLFAVKSLLLVFSFSIDIIVAEIRAKIYKAEQPASRYLRAVNAGLFEMIVGVLTTCRTKYT